MSNNSKGAISENKKVWNFDGYDYEEFPDEIMKHLCLNPFLLGKKMFSRPDGFMLYGKLGLTFSPPLNCCIQI